MALTIENLKTGTLSGTEVVVVPLQSAASILVANIRITNVSTNGWVTLWLVGPDNTPSARYLAWEYPVNANEAVSFNETVTLSAGWQIKGKSDGTSMDFVASGLVRS